MDTNPCLRPASRREVEAYYRYHAKTISVAAVKALMDLYDAEWRKRGFERSP